jgi:Fe-S-cluster containining protein
MITPKDLPNQAKKKEAENKKLFNKLKKNRPNDLDEIVHDLHDEVFAEMDCMTCANCCKTTSPIFKMRDIERLAKHFKMKTNDFISKYLHIDEDDDYVLNSAPCAFLADDNSCIVYENRPDACREYPHTDRRKFYQLLDLTLKNTFICPAAFEIVERMKKRFEKV